MLTSLEWQTLEQRRRISRLVMMYKIQHQLMDIDRDLYLRPGDSRTRVNLGSSRRGPIMTLRNSFQRTALGATQEGLTIVNFLNKLIVSCKEDVRYLF
jgi:hypothetical protein